MANQLSYLDVTTLMTKHSLEEQIFSHLDFNNLINSRLVCKSWYKSLTSRKKLWTNLLDRAITSEIDNYPVEKVARFLCPILNEPILITNKYKPVTTTLKGKDIVEIEQAKESWIKLATRLRRTNCIKDMIQLIGVTHHFDIFWALDVPKVLIVFQHEYFMAFKLMIKHNLIQTEKICLFLEKSIMSCNEEMVKYIIPLVDVDKPIQPYNHNETTYLHFASWFGNLEIYKEIHKASKDKIPWDVNGKTPFHGMDKNDIFYHDLLEFIEENNPEIVPMIRNLSLMTT